MNIANPCRYALSTAALLAAGCSTPGEVRGAAVEAHCKVGLVQPGRINYDPNRRDPLEQTEARAALAGSDYRLSRLNTPLGIDGVLEQALRDCR